jgi:arylsulfatase A-like enzyme
VFERHYTPCPLTGPARASLWTGLEPALHGAVINGYLPGERAFGRVREDAPLLPEMLAQAGYRVVHVGTQPVRREPPLERACEGVEFIGPSSAAEHQKQLESRGLFLGDRGVFRTPVVEHDRGRPVVLPANSVHAAVFPLREELYLDRMLSQSMVELISSHASSGPDAPPLALIGCFHLAHPPLWAPEDYANLVKPRDVNLPPDVGLWHKGMPALQLLNPAGHLGVHATQDQWRKAWAMYLGMVALLDRCLGDVLRAIERAGWMDRAAIAFTSDFGQMMGSHGLYQGMCLYEPAVRVPMMLKLPRQRQGKRVATLTLHQDLPATLLDIAGAPGYSHGRAISLRSAADPTAPAVGTRPHACAAYDGNAGRGFHQRMIRTSTHKLIHNVGDRPELYDLIEDPTESLNHAGDPQFAEVQAQLTAELSRWMAEVKDPLPAP